MKEKILIVLLALLFVASIAVGVTLITGGTFNKEQLRFLSGREGYGVVNLYGAIKSAQSSGLLGTPREADAVVARLQAMGRNPLVKAVVLRVNSPGGSVAASQEIYEEVRRLATDKRVPVVVSISDLGASGGYYVSCGATKIFANPGSLVGSVGVISIFPNIQGLLSDKLGVKATVLTSGKWKDAGSPLREMTGEERDRFQKQIAGVYDQFFEVVKKARLGLIRDRLRDSGLQAEEAEKKALEQLQTLAQGQIYTGEDAYIQGLIDQLGNFHDAVVEAKRLGGLPPDAPMIGSPSGVGLGELISPLAGAARDGGLMEAADSLTTSRIEYLYLPGGLLK